ncbi:MAG: PAS domain-containing protein, partial [Pseudomonadota bacterium]
MSPNLNQTPGSAARPKPGAEPRVPPDPQTQSHSSSFAEHVIQHSPLLIVAVAADASAKVLSINDAGCRILGYSRAELLGQQWWAMAYADGEFSPS